MWCVSPSFALACRPSPQQFFARHRRKPGHSERVVLGQSVAQVVRSRWQSLSPERAASQPSNISFKRTAAPPLNSSVRLHNRFRVSGKSTPASRSRSASASFFVVHPAGLRVLHAGAGVVLRNLRACSFAHPFRSRQARCVATSPLRKRLVCRTQALTISRSCGAFGVALSFIKGRASCSA